jgi:hypothetical protein
MGLLSAPSMRTSVLAHIEMERSVGVDASSAGRLSRNVQCDAELAGSMACRCLD